MSGPSAAQKDPLSAPAPIAGPLFREAAQVPLSPGEKARERRLLLVLIAAYADAGHDTPSVRELARRLGVESLLVIERLQMLERDGVIRVRWVNRKRQGQGGRNHYELRLNGRAER